ncbi:MAG: hypothetical protein CMJ49_05405 [Planctomycetaceae bacterium]|nr:hypothetical protein [Planctomycetaceae bacterium]
MSQHTTSAQPPVSETGLRVNAVSEWRSSFTGITGALLLFESVTGLLIYLLPFSRFNQYNVVLHTVLGLLMLAPVPWYMWRHWRVRRGGNLSHYQLLGYAALVLLVACVVSGLIIMWQGLVGPRIAYVWDITHLVSGVAVIVFVVVHLLTVIIRKSNNPEAKQALRSARSVFYRRSFGGCALLLVLCGVLTATYSDPEFQQGFSEDYNWRFGEDRPFAPSLAKVDNESWYGPIEARLISIVDGPQRDRFRTALQTDSIEAKKSPFAHIRACAEELGFSDEQFQELETVLAEAARRIKSHGAIDPRLLAGSDNCGTSGCHEQILEEWLPSAHRYSSLDDMFQRVQTLMAVETSPEHTRYCAGCHDPISLFSGAKDSNNITLNSVGANEGSSCLVCHSIVRTDVHGNADYTIRVPRRYIFELNEGAMAKTVSDFLIRTYPQQHIKSYSRPLYKTAEFCAACHKQYLDEEVNTDIGNVQGQNQYDSWKNSRWYHDDDQTRTISCRECHMPLVDSRDPARGDMTDYNRFSDDNKHRSHRTLASNQYMSEYLELPGAEVHTKLTEQWLRGEIEIPEVEGKWTSGPVVRMQIVAPQQVAPGDNVSLQVVLANNKTGHDFPTGPLDMIESWVELKATDAAGNVLYHTGYLDEANRIVETGVWYKADGFDRKGELVDRHNLWDLVGASYKRTLYPGMTDTLQVEFQCPSMARGRIQGQDLDSTGQRVDEFAFPAPAEAAVNEIHITASLWYRKANPEFIERVYGEDSDLVSTVTEMTRATTVIKVENPAHAKME